MDYYRSYCIGYDRSGDVDGEMNSSNRKSQFCKNRFIYKLHGFGSLLLVSRYKMRRNVLVVSRVRGLLDSMSKSKVDVDGSRMMQGNFKLFTVDDMFGERQLHEDIDVIIADPNHEFLLSHIDTKFPNLKFMQSTFAGVNALINGSTRRNYICSRIGTGFGPQMVEYVFAHILQHSSQVEKAEAFQREKMWNADAFNTKFQLSGKVLGIMGSGDIGKSLAKVGKVLGMNVIGLCRESRDHITGTSCDNSNKENNRDNNRSNGASESIYFNKLTTSVDDILQFSDYIVNCLPSTPQTKYLLNKTNLAKNLYKRTIPPFFCNVGRGDIISEETLLFAVNSKLFSRAVLDVFEKEPLPMR
jgi:phosphoglycerate dehydrogenase-like enzyme